jgi:hypothetical protein
MDGAEKLIYQIHVAAFGFQLQKRLLNYLQMRIGFTEKRGHRP